MAIQLTTEQSAALNAIKSFLCDDTLDAFVLRGSAGTGKTTLIARLVDMLEEMNLSCALLAPTGRAARILGNRIKQITGKPEYAGSTIHRKIYTLTQVEVNEEAVTANDPGVRMIFPLTVIATGATPDDEREFGVEGDEKRSRNFLAARPRNLT